ncbi:MAG: hypothetical protein ACYCQI_14545 [Gammaproteobacteria bacterium]
MSTREIYDTFKYTKVCVEACEYQGHSSDPCVNGVLGMSSCIGSCCLGMFGLFIDGTRYAAKKTRECCQEPVEGPRQQMML